MLSKTSVAAAPENRSTKAAEQVASILGSIQSLDAYRDLIGSLKSQSAPTGLHLPRAARLPVLAALHADLKRPILFVTDRADHALSSYDELGFWLASARHLFAEPNPLFYEEAAWGATTRRERLQTLTALAAYHFPVASPPHVPPVILVSARSLMTRTLPRADFLAACKRLSQGDTIQLQMLVRDLTRIGYQRVNTVLEPGQYSQRGGLLDIWTPSESNPARLDFFGDLVETIRRFDPASQRTLDAAEWLLVTPAREFQVPDSGGVDSKLNEFHIPLLTNAQASLLDYLPADTLILIDDMSLVESTVTEFEEQAVKLRQESIEEGILPVDFPVPYLTWSELSDSMQSRVVLELGRAGEDSDDATGLAANFAHDERFGGRLKPFTDYLTTLVEKGARVYVVSRQAHRLQDLWNEDPDHQSETYDLQFLESSLSEGFTLQALSGSNLHLITDSEIFGWERPQPRIRQKQVAETPESIYADLQTGDLVVHVDHGIGRFTGLIQRQLEGHEREFLSVEYDGGDALFVPVHQADRLTRYIGPDAGLPGLDRLGGQQWAETKIRVKEAVRKVAGELLDLYARRQVVKGFSFSADTAWQAELEDSFPYVETDDQRQAIQEIKRDMERPRPMDRLLCGDVGYGKTEVALRAAFKAVMDGRQVAILVPTTVLAQQHFETFTQRLAAFPVKVEMLSRFRTAREQNDILLQLGLGEVDIVIGTHRLISSDVQFKDLGLVIIDEEQRFGVTHKEHLKKLRTEVDVLTLTATPIPRTLYMALTGVRDISNLNTAPEERLPIVTHVGPYSPRLVRQSVLRELERGGQIFFVHNRVNTIDAMRMHLAKLVPEARVDVAHGQMPEQQLADVMHTFNSGAIDILLSTTIIESGLDIPNANTLIVDRADTFGLAQLYQLRGRVGRGAMRAYAYFFRHGKLTPTLEGQQRLDVIAENTQLGAGYSIAMRDLEIRGAGDLLGTRQHGHIAAVGFHLYTRLLADAVRHLRRASSEAARDSSSPFASFNLPIAMPVNVELPLAVGIPSAYIADRDLRLRLYRRIADLRDASEIDALASEFNDRFGMLPEMVQNLLYQMRVKLLAERAGLSAINWEGGQIVLRFPAAGEEKPAQRLPDLGPGIRGGKGAYWCSLGEKWSPRLLQLLAELADRGHIS